MSSGDEPDKLPSPDCRRCKHFKVTWDPKWPHACIAMGFRSQVLPSVEVRRADGTSCLSFEDIKGTAQEETKKVLFRGRHIDTEC
jgi:hypothetical protein